MASLPKSDETAQGKTGGATSNHLLQEDEQKQLHGTSPAVNKKPAKASSSSGTRKRKAHQNPTTSTNNKADAVKLSKKEEQELLEHRRQVSRRSSQKYRQKESARLETYQRQQGELKASNAALKQENAWLRAQIQGVKQHPKTKNFSIQPMPAKPKLLGLAGNASQNANPSLKKPPPAAAAAAPSPATAAAASFLLASASAPTTTGVAATNTRFAANKNNTASTNPQVPLQVARASLDLTSTRGSTAAAAAAAAAAAPSATSVRNTWAPSQQDTLLMWQQQQQQQQQKKPASMAATRATTSGFSSLLQESVAPTAAALPSLLLTQEQERRLLALQQEQEIFLQAKKLQQQESQKHQKMQMASAVAYTHAAAHAVNAGSAAFQEQELELLRSMAIQELQEKEALKIAAATAAPADRLSSIVLQKQELLLLRAKFIQELQNGEAQQKLAALAAPMGGHTTSHSHAQQQHEMQQLLRARALQELYNEESQRVAVAERTVLGSSSSSVRGRTGLDRQQTLQEASLLRPQMPVPIIDTVSNGAIEAGRRQFPVGVAGLPTPYLATAASTRTSRNSLIAATAPTIVQPRVGQGQARFLLALAAQQKQQRP